MRFGLVDRRPASVRGRARGLNGRRTAPVVFMHIPKTAGSSLTNMLEPHYAPGEVFRSPEPGSLSRLGSAELQSYSILCGHFDWSELGNLPKKSQIICLLRDPIDRIVSLYWYWRSFSWEYAAENQDYGIAYAKSVGIEEFFFDAPLGIRANYENAVVRQLVGADFCTAQVGFKNSDEAAINLAKSRIDQMSVCGLMEDMSGSAILISQALGIRDLRVRFDNRGPPSCARDRLEGASLLNTGGELARRLEALTSLDREVFQHACDKHCERLVQLAA